MVQNISFSYPSWIRRFFSSETYAAQFFSIPVPSLKKFIVMAAWEGSLDVGGTGDRFDTFIWSRALQTWELFSVAEAEITVHLFFHLKSYLIHGQNFKKIEIWCFTVPQCIHRWLQESLIWARALMWAPGHLCLKTLSRDHWVTHTQEAQRPQTPKFSRSNYLPWSHWGDY